MLLLVWEPAIVESSTVAFVIAGAVAEEKDRLEREKVTLSPPMNVVEFDLEALI